MFRTVLIGMSLTGLAASLGTAGEDARPTRGDRSATIVSGEPSSVFSVGDSGSPATFNAEPSLRARIERPAPETPIESAFLPSLFPTDENAARLTPTRVTRLTPSASVLEAADGRLPARSIQLSAHTSVDDAPDVAHSTINERQLTSTIPPLPLAPPSEPRPRTSGSERTKRDSPNAGRAMFTVFSSLAVVLGLFFAVIWVTRRAMPKGTLVLPPEAVEVLGRTQLNPKQQMHLVRVGNKLLLVTITPNGMETLTEITDPDEVERLVTICQQSQPNSISATFRQVLSQLGSEPANGGFLGEEQDELELANAGRRERYQE